MRPHLLLLAVLVAALLAAPVCADGAAASPWFSEYGWSAYKTSDTLESIGAGPSISVYQWAEDHALWLDLALLYDGAAETVGGFGGLSTEIAGQPILEAITAPIRLLSKDLLSNAGIGAKYTEGEWTPLLYVTTRF